MPRAADGSDDTFTPIESSGHA